MSLLSRVLGVSFMNVMSYTSPVFLSGGWGVLSLTSWRLWLDALTVQLSKGVHWHPGLKSGWASHRPLPVPVGLEFPWTQLTSLSVLATRLWCCLNYWWVSVLCGLCSGVGEQQLTSSSCSEPDVEVDVTDVLHLADDTGHDSVDVR